MDIKLDFLYQSKTKHFFMKKQYLITLFIYSVLNFSTLLVMSQNKADYIFTNGKVYTVNKNNPWAEAVAVKDSVIVFVGNSQESVQWIGKNTKVIDLNGRMLMPGFVDGHNHFIFGAAAKRGVSFVGVNGRQNILDNLKKYVKANPSKSIYIGYGWTYPAIGDVKINRHTLDSICNNKPIFLFNEDGHVVLHNTKTMTLTCLTKNTKDVSKSSYFEREPDGTPSGVIVETEAYMPVAIKLKVLGGKEMLLDLMNDMYPKLSKWGITSYYDMGIFAPQLSDAYKGYEILNEWEKAGKLHVRVAGVYGVREANLSPQATIDTMVAWRKKYNSRFVSLRGLKIWSDGTPDSHTGVQLEPYFDKPETKGESPFTEKVLEGFIAQAYKAGFDVHIHTQGDGSARRCLDAFEAVSKITDASERRSALHHISVLDPADLIRFKELHIGANATLEWLVTYWDQAYVVFGKEKVERTFDIWKRLVDMGVNTTYGNDIPGTNPEESFPLYQIQAALTGKIPYMQQTTRVRTPDRVPSLEQLIKGYTINGAYEMHMEKKIGSVEVGKLADMIVLDKNIFEIPQDKLAAVQVELTMFNGNVIHEVSKKTKKEFK